MIKKAIAMVMLCWVSLTAYAQSITGSWLSFDEQTGKPRAVIQLTITQGILHGTIMQVYKKPGDTGKCKLCPGAFKDKPVVGLQMVWGLQETQPGIWTGGSILDPKSGKIYRAKMTLEGDRLLVRGYIGISLLGRTQIWKRQ